jgi:hypothetical protein
MKNMVLCAGILVAWVGIVQASEVKERKKEQLDPLAALGSTRDLLQFSPPLDDALTQLSSSSSSDEGSHLQIEVSRPRGDSGLDQDMSATAAAVQAGKILVVSRGKKEDTKQKDAADLFKDALGQHATVKSGLRTHARKGSMTPNAHEWRLQRAKRMSLIPNAERDAKVQRIQADDSLSTGEKALALAKALREIRHLAVPAAQAARDRSDTVD